MLGITPIIFAYNEEKRFSKLLISVSMYDKVMVVDKSSIDRTREIAEQNNAFVITAPYENSYTGDELRRIYSMAGNEWILSLTAADIVHPKLYAKLHHKINRESFTATVVGVPWVEWLFGYEGDNILWCNYSRSVLFKYDKINVNNRVHEEFDTSNCQTYILPKNKKNCCLSYDLRQFKIYLYRAEY